jgi:hypothetical protein
VAGQGRRRLVLRSCLLWTISNSGEERLLLLVLDVGMQELWVCFLGVSLAVPVDRRTRFSGMYVHGRARSYSSRRTGKEKIGCSARIPGCSLIVIVGLCPGFLYRDR